MPDTSSFVSNPFQVISDLAQLKAFTDPLRVHILHILQSREATNQQVTAISGSRKQRCCIICACC